MGEMADYLLEHADYADYDVGGVLEVPRKTGGSKVETIPPNCSICSRNGGCRLESGTRLCLNRRF